MSQLLLSYVTIKTVLIDYILYRNDKCHINNFLPAIILVT